MIHFGVFCTSTSIVPCFSGRSKNLDAKYQKFLNTVARNKLDVETAKGWRSGCLQMFVYFFFEIADFGLYGYAYATISDMLQFRVYKAGQ